MRPSRAVLATVLAFSVAAPAAASPGPVAALRIDGSISYPYFPCAFWTYDCTTSLDGTVSGALAGVENGTAWAVTFDAATLTSTVGYGTLWLGVGEVAEALGYCRYENTRGPAVVDTAASGTYGGVDVTGLRLTGNLAYLRVEDKLAMSLDFPQLVLRLADATEVTVTPDSAFVGGGTWTADGTPADCLSYDNPVPLGARVSTVLG